MLLPPPTHPPDAAAEFDWQAVTASPPPATLAPVAAIPAPAATLHRDSPSNTAIFDCRAASPCPRTTHRRIPPRRLLPPLPQIAGWILPRYYHDTRTANLSRHSLPACNRCGAGSQDRPVWAFIGGTHAGCSSRHPRTPHSPSWKLHHRAPVQRVFLLPPESLA